MKRILKRSFKLTGVALLVFIGLVLLYLGAAYCLSRLAVNSNVASKEEVTIYILTNGVHTDIVLPITTESMRWSDYIKFENTESKDSNFSYVAVGWGDKGFYLETPTWADLQFSTAFKAAFSLGNSAIHATFYHSIHEGDNCKSIRLGVSEYNKLVQYVSASFQKTESGELIPIQTNANYGKNDAFYEAVGSYSLFHTCNTWANNGLKSCDQKACYWTPFDTGIFYHYSK